MKQVKVDDKYSDVTFCMNEKCRKKTCYRHICHNSNPYWVSIAMFEGTSYCLKKVKNNDKR